MDSTMDWEPKPILVSLSCLCQGILSQQYEKTLTQGPAAKRSGWLYTAGTEDCSTNNWVENADFRPHQGLVSSMEENSE